MFTAWPTPQNPARFWRPKTQMRGRKEMLQWRPRLIVLMTILVVIAVAASGYLEDVFGLTW
jgi:hypothetical protein